MARQMPLSAKPEQIRRSGSQFFRFARIEPVSTGSNIVMELELNTVPSYHYVIEFADGDPADESNWQAFENATNGVGRWTETALTETPHLFPDDYTAATSGFAPANGHRFYRARVVDLRVPGS